MTLLGLPLVTEEYTRIGEAKILKAFVIYSFLFMNMGSASAGNLNFYTGMFDFSDDGKKSNLFGVQHINTEDSYFENLQPVTGAMITADNATYFYKGFQIQNGDGAFKFTQVSLLVCILREMVKIWVM